MGKIHTITHTVASVLYSILLLLLINGCTDDNLTYTHSPPIFIPSGEIPTNIPVTTREPKYALEGEVVTDVEKDRYEVMLDANHYYKIEVTADGFDPMLRIFEDYESDSTNFVADNNGAGGFLHGSDARLYFYVQRGAVHTIEVMPAHIVLNNNPYESIGTYRLTVEQMPADFSTPAALTHTSRLPTDGLTQPSENYELVVAEEFNTELDSDSIFKVERPYLYVGCRINTRRNYSWETNSRRVLRIVKGDGDFSSALYQGIAVPYYTEEYFSDALDIFRRYNCDWQNSELTDDGWQIRNGEETWSVQHGEIPSSRDPASLSADGKDGYFASYLDTMNSFETRYGYFEVEVDFSDFRNYPGFKHAFWMSRSYRYRTDTVAANLAELAEQAKFLPYEIDIAEIRSRSDRLQWHFRIHINKRDKNDENLHHYSKEDKDFISMDKNRFQWGMEWTPESICLFIDRKKQGCMEDWLHNGSEYGKLITQGPLAFILNSVAHSWGDDPIQNRAELLEELENNKGDGSVGVRVNYFRVFQAERSLWR